MKSNRRQSSLLLFFLFITIYILHINWIQPNQENLTTEKARTWMLDELTQTQQELSSSLFHLSDTAQLRENYRKARLHYKNIELFVEYISPRPAKYFINGSLVPKFDEDMGSTAIQPHGFQKIEEILFTPSDGIDTVFLAKEYKALIQHLESLRNHNYYQRLGITDGVLLEICQLQLYRIAAMNLNGYDATITLDGVQESIYCLDGIETLVDLFQTYSTNDNQVTPIYAALQQQLLLAKKQLENNKDYNSFQRLPFITDCINPLNKLLVAFHNACHLSWSKRMQALDLKQPFLFGKESFNARFFSIYTYDTTHVDRQIELGKILFSDPVLSGNNKRSCASCHHPTQAFTDGLSKSISMDGIGVVQRNAPTLLNVMYQHSFFDDGRASLLEQQLFEVLHNKNEMQSSVDDVATKLKKSKAYRLLFAYAFAGTNDTAITSYAITKAIVEYEKTLVSLNSKFDKYLRGNKNELTEREVNGYNLFAGKALCGSCHFFPLFNGTVPPYFGDSEFEIIGTPATSQNKTLDTDSGRFYFTKIKEQLFAFKTPTIRNVALTAPYMHNGAYTKLEDVVEFYHKGGGAGVGFTLPNQTLPFDSLQLTSHEKEDIVLFMKILTDTVSTIRQPKTLPLFEKDAVLNKRKVGGEY